MVEESTHPSSEGAFPEDLRHRKGQWTVDLGLAQASWSLLLLRYKGIVFKDLHAKARESDCTSLVHASVGTFCM